MASQKTETASSIPEELDSIFLLGKRVARIREELNLSQGAFAEILNLNVAYISLLENGKARPGIKFVFNISSKFNVDPNYLLNGEGPMFFMGDASLEDSDSKAAKALFLIQEDQHLVKLFWYLRNSSIVRFGMLKYLIISLNHNLDDINFDLTRHGFDKNDLF